MLKLRLQGSMRDIKWFLKMINRDKRFIKNNPSDPMDIQSGFPGGIVTLLTISVVSRARVC